MNRSKKGKTSSFKLLLDLDNILNPSTNQTTCSETNATTILSDTSEQSTKKPKQKKNGEKSSLNQNANAHINHKTVHYNDLPVIPAKYNKILINN